MPYLILVLIFLQAGRALADTSLFFKVATLRFGKEEPVQAEKGFLDISGLGDSELFHIQGEALFLPARFLEPVYPSEVEFQNLKNASETLKVELSLSNRAYPLESTSANFGTFLLRMHSDRARELSLQIPRYYHPLEIFVVTAQGSQRLIRFGKLDQNPAHNWNRSTPLIPPTRFEVPAGDFYLIAHASSPLVNGKNTLNFSTFFLGETPHINGVFYLCYYLAKLISGSFFILSVFYLFIYFFSPRDRSSLFLSLYALASFGLSLIYIVDLNLTPSGVVTLFTVVNILGVMCLQCYLLEKIAFVTKPRMQRLLMGLAVAVGFGGALLRFWGSNGLTSIFFVLSFVGSSVLIGATLYLGLKHQLAGITFFFVGAALNLTFQYSMLMRFILHTKAESGYYILLANLCMAVALALVNAKEFALTYKRSVQQSRDLEEFNKNLEKIVETKTNEIRSLLDHIPQGVLSLGANGILAKDYSAHLEMILETDQIANRSFKELVLDSTPLSADSRDQIWQSLLATIGADEIAFELNRDHLPGELIYRVHGKEKYLKTHWNIESRQGIVSQILVTLLDISVERELEKTAGIQRDELALILELVNVDADKAAQFFSTALPLLKENQDIVADSNNLLTPASIRMLYVNAHTVKGAARTLHFSKMAAVIHEMEGYYAELLRDTAEPDRERLHEDMQRALQTMQAYMDVNRQKLNRSEDFASIVIDREFVEHHYNLLKSIVSRPDRSAGEIVESLRSQSEYFSRLIFEPLRALLDEYKGRASKIAKDLNKAPPNFDIDIDDIALSPARRTILDRCMIHLLRNAMDHGIECPEERLKKGKSTQGMITIRARDEDGFLKLTLQDDGRGLAIGKLRRKAEQACLLPAAAPLEAVAETIFATGISTAAILSDISGRGVGMNAVRSFVENAGGQITIRLGQANDPELEYFDFSIEVLLPLDQEPSSRPEPQSKVS